MKRFLVLVLAAACSLMINGHEKPRVTIITSVFNGNEFIEGFMEDIVHQSIFSSCELILINPNSPGNEEPIIQQYTARYPNIIYLKLSEDPGLYAVWNIAIAMASADLITNANLDDRRNPQSLEIQANALDQDHTVDLVYGDYLITYNSNETFEHNNYSYVVQTPDFEPQKMHLCLGGPQPMWRKSLHSNYGFFRTDFYSSGDWEMWCRAVSGGARLKKIPDFISGLFYQNPHGLSTDKDAEKTARRNQENKRIIEQYCHLWQ